LDERQYKKCFKRWLSLLQSSQAPPEQKQELYDAFMSDMKQYRLTIGKVNHILQILNQEQDHYQAEMVTIQEQIQQRSQEIQQLKEQLKHEKQQEEHRKQYDHVAKTVLEYPSKEESEREIKALQETMETLKEEQEKITKRYEQQRKRIQNLLCLLDEVDNTIEKEMQEVEEEGELIKEMDGESLEEEFHEYETAYL
jgi:chromosome segregation ATPase